jgi:ERCC4-type nuclease
MQATVIIDRNEHKPWGFPKTIKWYKDRNSRGKLVIVKTERKVLKAGDYLLKGSEDVCIVERKASLEELSNNLFGDDYQRARDAFKRLSEATAHPYLAIECSLGDLTSKSKWVQEPARVMDALMSLMERLRFRFILLGRVRTLQQKRHAGELVLRLMLSHVYQQERNYGNTESLIQRISNHTHGRKDGVRDGSDPE